MSSHLLLKLDKINLQTNIKIFKIIFTVLCFQYNPRKIYQLKHELVSFISFIL